MTDATGLQVVSAGAGSGKTYRITEVVEEALTCGAVQPEEIAAITFTEAAAGDLEARLKRRLYEKGHVELAGRIDAAYVTTIHGFCLRLLREHPLESGFHPDTEVLSEQESSLIIQRILSQIVDESGHSQDVRYLLDHAFGDYAGGGSFQTAEERLEQAVRRMVDLARSTRKDAEDLAALAEANDAELEDRLAELGTPLEANEIWERIRVLLRRWDEWRAENPGARFKYVEQSAEAMRRLRLLVGQYAAGVDGRSNGGRGASGELGLPPVEQLLQVKMGKGGPGNGHQDLAADVDKALAEIVARHPGEWERLRRVARSFFALTARTLERYQQEKEELGVLDYSDMQSRALDLIEHGGDRLPFVAYLQSKIRLLVVDEFQDTSPIQFAITEALRGQGRLPVVYVGDLKQAIYRFRNADSTILQGLLDALRDSAQSLDRNWRSRPELVRFANDVFARLLPASGMRFEPLEPASVYASQSIELSPPALAVWQFPARDGNAEQRSVALARQIHSILNEGRETWDPVLERRRPYRPADIAVIASTNDELEAMAQALALFGVPTVREQSGFFSSVPFRLFRSLVSCLISPVGTRDLAVILASELVGVSQDGVFALGRAGLLRRWGRLARAISMGDDDDLAALDWAALEPPAPESAGRDEGDAPTDGAHALREAWECISAEDRAALARFAGQWLVLSQVLREQPLAQACERIADEVDFVACMRVTRGLQDEANAARCLEIVHGFAGFTPSSRERLGIGTATPEGLLAYLDAIVDIPEYDTQPTPNLGDGGGVHLLTIHRSKGLEYPVVVWISGDKRWTPRLPRAEAFRDGVDPLDPELLQKTSLRYFPTSQSDQINDVFLADAMGEARAEALRCLYVAFTRAKEQLIIVQRMRIVESSYASLLDESGYQVNAETGEIRVGSGAERFAAEVVDLIVPDKDELEELFADGYGDAALEEPEAVALLAATTESIGASPQESRQELLQAPSHEPPILKRLPASQLIDYLDCPAQYELLHRLGVPYRGTSRHEGPPVALRNVEATDPAPIAGAIRSTTDLGQDELGNLAHLVLQLTNPAVNGGDAEQTNRVLDRVLGAYPEDEDLLRKYLSAVVDVVAWILEGRRIQAACAERPILMPVNGTIVEGTIDLACLEADGWHIYDFKAVEFRDAGDLPRYVAHYRPQLDLYAAAWESARGEQLKGAHLVFVNQRTVVDLEVADREGTLERVASAADAIANERFDKHPERVCGMCVYRSQCGRREVAV